MVARILSVLAGVVVWLPFSPPRRPQSEEIDRAISDVWRRRFDGEISEEEAGRRDAGLRAQRSAAR
jgi:hypothetical protein